MQVVIQRVQRAAVTVGDEVSGRIGPGLLALVGVGRHSTEADAAWLASKTVALRVFGDDAGRMNRSVADVGGAVLAVSQFTLYGDVSRGRRPSFVDAADPADGQRLYEAYCAAITVPVAKGVFGAHMVIDLIADGPVTMLLRRETVRPVGQDMR
ncbi:MAG: D-tyrosyl-tRNA(Tyr) deacylase [Euzebyaceae bacterium]|nr:D-tyrosyl-tRNA(Tyr) deacylase [Euzebyaceae bacterium]